MGELRLYRLRVDRQLEYLLGQKIKINNSKRLPILTYFQVEMKAIINILFTVINVLSFSTITYAQQNEFNSIDTIRIDKKDFESMVVSRIKFMEMNDTMNIIDAIDMVRITNAIAYNRNILTADIYNKYLHLFYGKYNLEAANLLKATLSRNMSLYSKKYNLYFGGPPHGNSRYFIIDR